MGSSDREVCSGCGGEGGRPLGPSNPGWDIETYECIRCGGSGYLRAADEKDAATSVAARPGLAKASSASIATEEAGRQERGRRTSGR